MNSTSSKGTDIPLHCLVCKPEPIQFCDVSHLLTHVNSKGHAFAVDQAGRSPDPAKIAKKLEYEKWYKDNGIRDLLVERLNSKGKKRPARSRSQKTNVLRTTNAGVKKEFKRNYSPADSVATTTGSEGTQHSINFGYHPYNPSAPPSAPFPPIDPTLQAGSHSLSFQSSQPIPLNAFSRSGYSPYPYPPNGYTPTVSKNPNPASTVRALRRSRASARGQENAPSMVRGQGQTGLRSTSTSPSTYTPLCSDSDQETSILRGGIQLPGMGGFDSATEHMKRRRNQKKDASVLTQLEINSRLVQPVQHTWTSDGSLKTSREINGIPSSPPPEASPSFEDNGLVRLPLLDIYPGHETRHQPEHDDLAQRHAIMRDEALETELSWGVPKRRRPVRVFRDESEDDEPTATFGSPAPFRHLTSEFQHHNRQMRPSQYEQNEHRPISSGFPCDQSTYHLPLRRYDEPSHQVLELHTQVMHHPMHREAVHAEVYTSHERYTDPGQYHAINDTAGYGIPTHHFMSYPSHQYITGYNHDLYTSFNRPAIDQTDETGDRLPSDDVLEAQDDDGTVSAPPSEV